MVTAAINSYILQKKLFPIQKENDHGLYKFCDVNQADKTHTSTIISEASRLDLNLIQDTSVNDIGFKITWVFIDRMTPEFVCDFENGFCSGWTQSQSDEQDWLLHRGETKTELTGPMGDHTIGLPLIDDRGYYLYADSSSPSKEDDRAILLSPVLPGGKRLCFSYWYNLNSVNIQNGVSVLYISLIDRNEQKYNTQQISLVNKLNNPDWQQGFYTYDLVKGNSYYLIVLFKRGTNFAADIALDDLEIIFTDLGEECPNDPRPQELRATEQAFLEDYANFPIGTEFPNLSGETFTLPMLPDLTDQPATFNPFDNAMTFPPTLPSLVTQTAAIPDFLNNNDPMTSAPNFPGLDTEFTTPVGLPDFFQDAFNTQTTKAALTDDDLAALFGQSQEETTRAVNFENLQAELLPTTAGLNPEDLFGGPLLPTSLPTALPLDIEFTARPTVNLPLDLDGMFTTNSVPLDMLEATTKDQLQNLDLPNLETTQPNPQNLNQNPATQKSTTTLNTTKNTSSNTSNFVNSSKSESNEITSNPNSPTVDITSVDNNFSELPDLPETTEQSNLNINPFDELTTNGNELEVIEDQIPQTTDQPGIVLPGVTFQPGTPKNAIDLSGPTAVPDLPNLSFTEALDTNSPDFNLLATSNPVLNDLPTDNLPEMPNSFTITLPTDLNLQETTNSNRLLDNTPNSNFNTNLNTNAPEFVKINTSSNNLENDLSSSVTLATNQNLENLNNNDVVTNLVTNPVDLVQTETGVIVNTLDDQPTNSLNLATTADLPNFQPQTVLLTENLNLFNNDMTTNIQGDFPKFFQKIAKKYFLSFAGNLMVPIHTNFHNYF